MTISLLKDYKNKHPIDNKNLSITVMADDQKNKKLDALSELNHKIAEAMLIITEVITILDNSCSKYVKILTELMKVKEEETIKTYGPQANKKKTKNKANRKATTKKMYGKIANECHPDKTQDTEKHKLFIEATLAMENGDDFKMYEIYKNFDDEILLEDCINIETEILSKTLELSKIRSTNSYKISIIYKNGKSKEATSIYLQGLLEQIQKIEMEIWSKSNI